MPLAAALLICSALAGCGLEIAEQRYASMKPMLARQAPPKCEYRATRPDKSGSRQQGEQPAAEAADLRAKLDYERQCYRHAEIIARNRLKGLQKAVEETAKATKAETAAKAADVGPPPQP